MKIEETEIYKLKENRFLTNSVIKKNNNNK